jgi:mannose-6-phosphate isomerase-like protein (cupin superfamily)
VLQFLESKGYTLKEEDFQKPWGGYFRINDEHLHDFIDAFFPDHSELKESKEQLSPKILVVMPQARLSWQYHHRRAEIWKVLFGPIRVMKNNSDEQTEPEEFQTGELVELAQGERHRLIGAENWGVVAEIWKHTDNNAPSSEEDIVRVQDDYGR